MTEELGLWNSHYDRHGFSHYMYVHKHTISHWDLATIHKYDKYGSNWSSRAGYNRYIWKVAIQRLENKTSFWTFMSTWWFISQYGLLGALNTCRLWHLKNHDRDNMLPSILPHKHFIKASKQTAFGTPNSKRILYFEVLNDSSIYLSACANATIGK